ncbi:MAG: restriction endonuclease subunit S [Vagococcus sp.]|nr:restriction endonuclease subunit S [Vagococcus sp.]
MINTKALREKILDLAMSGKLTNGLVIEKPNIKKLGEVCEIARGGSPRPIKSFLTEISTGVNWIKIGDTQVGDKYITSTQEKIIPEGLSKTRQVFKGDFLLSNSMSFGRPYILKIDGAIHDGWLVISNFKETFEENFLYHLLSSSFVKKQFINLATGSTVKNLNKERVASVEVPIFSLDEQERIVAKIEELFSFIDVIEQESADYDALAKQLDSKVLDLAMKGKLVPQDPTDEPTNELLKRIREEKERLIKEKKIKKERALPEITEEEKPYDIPDNWEWVRLSDIQDVRDGTHDTPSYVANGVPLITSKNLINGNLCFKNVKYISFEDADDIDKRSKVDSGDILFAMIGTIGNPVIVETHGQRISIKNVALLKQFSKEFSGEFVFQFLQSQQDFMRKNASGGLQKFYSLTMIRKMVAPCPPLEEQKRIVSKIKKIRSYL